MEEFNIKVDPIVNKIFVITAPSKHGKTEICHRLLKYLAERGQILDGCIYTNNMDKYTTAGYKNVSNFLNKEIVNSYVQHYKNVSEPHYLVFDNIFPYTHWETNSMLELCFNNKKNTTIIIASDHLISLTENVKSHIDYFMINGELDKIIKDRTKKLFNIPETQMTEFNKLSGFYYLVISKIPGREYMWFNNRRGILHRFMGSYLGY